MELKEVINFNQAKLLRQFVTIKVIIIFFVCDMILQTEILLLLHCQ